MDTLLYDVSIPVISSLQNKFSQQADFMQLMSVVFDPKYAFLIYSPIAYLLDQKVGQKLILTTVIAEWLNQILKWFLHGERPYWYVHSSGHFDPQQVPIKQFPITCELGPGHPSGHAMVTAAVWYIILDSLLQAYSTHMMKPVAKERSDQRVANGKILAKQQELPETRPPSPNSNVMSGPSSAHVKLSIWTLYALLLTTVSVSRVFLGCHFPHQCVAGAMLGFLVAKCVSSLHTKAIHFIGASIFLLVTAFGTFAILQALGLDPSWTINLATTHCVKREYIHLDTAPFFSIMRYCGFALGSGLGLLFPLKNISKQLMSTAAAAAAGSTTIEGEILVPSDKELIKNPLSSRNVSWFSIKIIMAMLMARLVDNLGLLVSHSNLVLFYTSAFFAYTSFSFAFINL